MTFSLFPGAVRSRQCSQNVSFKVLARQKHPQSNPTSWHNRTLTAVKITLFENMIRKIFKYFQVRRKSPHTIWGLVFLSGTRLKVFHKFHHFYFHTGLSCNEAVWFWQILLEGEWKTYILIFQQQLLFSSSCWNVHLGLNRFIKLN